MLSFTKKTTNFVHTGITDMRKGLGGTDDAAEAAEGIQFAIDEADLIPAHKRRKPKRKDRSLPAHLPRREVMIDADQADKTFPTHVGKPECGIASAERRPGKVEGGKYDASVAAQIITFKYGFHLPLYRLQDMFAGSGWTPSRGLMLNILNQSCFSGFGNDASVWK